ncbi:MAG TPA: hypothetical protein VIL78_05440 [Hanamia sp.]
MKSNQSISETDQERIYIRMNRPYFEVKPEPKKSFFQKLSNFINQEDQREEHFKWVGISMLIQAGILTPIVGLVILFTGNYLFFWSLNALAMYLTFIPSLAGVSVKIILSTFLISIVFCMAIIVSAIGVYIFI